MKVLVTTTGRTFDSPVEPRFGRAALFAVVELETGRLEIVENGSARAAAHGAGIRAAQLAADAGVTAVMTGHCGPKAVEALAAAGIQLICGVGGTVGEAVAAFSEGRLGGQAVKGRAG